MTMMMVQDFDIISDSFEVIENYTRYDYAQQVPDTE
jgi:hypothetical protein